MVRRDQGIWRVAGGREACGAVRAPGQAWPQSPFAQGALAQENSISSFYPLNLHQSNSEHKIGAGRQFCPQEWKTAGIVPLPSSGPVRRDSPSGSQTPSFFRMQRRGHGGSGEESQDACLEPSQLFLPVSPPAHLRWRTIPYPLGYQDKMGACT